MLLLSTGFSVTMLLTDTHLVLLSAASQRDDGLLSRPAKLAGAALLALEGALRRAGAAEAIPVRADQPNWRRDEANTPIGLRITPAALTTLGLEDAAPIEEQAARADVGGEVSATPTPRLPRAGSKLARLHAMLAEGATIDAAAGDLAWQPHTVRAALTRLRQGGLTITTSKNQQGKIIYRLGRHDQAAEGTSEVA